MKTLFQCEPGYEAALRAAGLLDFDFLMKAKGGPAASSHTHRETIPLEIAVDGQPKKFFLKRVFHVPPKHALAPFLRFQAGQSQPRLEWNMLGELVKTDIPAMRRVAFGERRRLGIPIQALLLVEAVPMPHTLEDWLVPGFPRPFRLDPSRCHRLLYEFGGLIRRLHAEGFRWPDLHPKHVFAEPLAQSSSDRQWRFCLIDVERMTRIDAGPLDETARRDLERLRQNMAPFPMTATHVHVFAAGYLGRDRRKKTASVESELGRLLRPEPLPCLPDDYEHPRVALLQPHERMFVDARLAAFFSKLGWRSMEDVFSYQSGQDLRKPGLHSYRERIRIQFPDGNGSASAYYLKRYDHPPLAEQLRRIHEYRPTRSSAAREIHFIKRLGQIGVPSLRSVAYGQEMSGVWEQRSFDLTAELDGQSLEKLVDQWNLDPASRPPARERQDIIRQLGWMVRLLHRHDLYHRDLYLSHVFLTRNADDRIVLQLIDLARMIERPWNPRRWAVKDLAALAYSSPSPFVTRADRVRFLYHYLNLEGLSKKENRSAVRDFLHDIDAKVRRIARHDRRRNVRLAGKAAP